MRLEPSQSMVAIVILNWNNPDDTLACLRSVEALAYPAEQLAVIVVDNGSTDDSVARIGAACPGVFLLQTGANLGYAGGNNVGIRYALAAGADTVCILNNDIIVEPDFLPPLLAALASAPDVGVATPLVAAQPAQNRVWALGARVEWRTGDIRRQYAGEPVAIWRQQMPFAVEIASGAALLIRREVFERVGLMDEAFFLYYEEVDWSLMVSKAGFRIVAVPASLVGHKVSATLGAASPAIDYYMARNHLRLLSRRCSGLRFAYLWSRVVLLNLLTIAVYTAKSHNGQRTRHRNARMFGLRDACLGRWGKMGPDVVKACFLER